MSKARRTSRTKPRSAVRRGTRSARAMARGKIDLGPIHAKLNDHARRLKQAEQTTKVKNALRRLQRCMNEMRSICGPTMVIPLG